MKKLLGVDALDQIKKIDYELAILDVMMPGMDGYELCGNIRKSFFFPILMVTAKGTDMDKITGLMMGDDDYIIKPFNPMEVVMRVKAQLRRNQVYSNVSKNNIGKSEYKSNANGNVVTPEELFGSIWKEKIENNNTVMVHITRIREKMYEIPRKPKYIKTVWGVGYKIG